MARKKRSNGYGSVSKVSRNLSKPWRATATIGWDDNGKQIRKSLGYFSTYKEANDALMSATKSGQSRVAENYNATVGELFEEYIDFRKNASKISVKTIQSYENGMRRLSSIKELPLRSLDIDDLQNLFQNLSKKKYSRSSIQDARMVLNQLYKYAIPRGCAEINLTNYLMLSLPKSKPTARFTKEEIKTLWENSEDPTVKIILCMIYTMTRPSELLALKIENITPNMTAVIGGCKTEAGTNRIIPLHDRIKEFIAYFTQDRKSGPIFLHDGKPILLNHFSKKMFKQVIMELGLSQALTPRSCRKTGISIMAENKNISEEVRIKIAGHTDAQVERDHYIEMEAGVLSEAINQIDI